MIPKAKNNLKKQLTKWCTQASVNDNVDVIFESIFHMHYIESYVRNIAVKLMSQYQYKYTN